MKQSPSRGYGNRRLPVADIFDPTATTGGMFVLIFVTVVNAILFVYARWKSWRGGESSER